jgi:hypothetical protein
MRNHEIKYIINIKKSQFINDNELFKKLNDTIWKYRTLYNSRALRLFAFWDTINGEENLVVATHGIIIKTQKTPINEIERAETFRKKIFKQKIN